MRPCPSFMSLRLSLPPPSTQPPPGGTRKEGTPLPPGPENTGDKELDALRAQAEAAGPKFPPRRLLPVRVQETAPTGAPPSPACLIPSSSCRRRLRSGSSIPSGTGAPAFQSQVTPEQDRRGRPSPRTSRSSIRMLSRSAPLHGYLSPVSPACQGPEDRDSSRQAASRRQARQ